MENAKPQIGMQTKPIAGLGVCTIIAVYLVERAIDVLAPNGRYYRISGLAWTN